MNIKLLFVLSILMMLSASCTKSPIDEQKGKAIAEKNLKNASSVEYFLKINVDVSKLPQPELEYQGNILLVDYEDLNQNISIVVMVHPDGSTEVSHMKINDDEDTVTGSNNQTP